MISERSERNYLRAGISECSEIGDGHEGFIRSTIWLKRRESC